MNFYDSFSKKYVNIGTFFPGVTRFRALFASLLRDQFLPLRKRRRAILPTSTPKSASWRKRRAMARRMKRTERDNRVM